MDTDLLTEKISDLLPERDFDHVSGDTRPEKAKEAAAEIVQAETAKELAAIRAREQERLRKLHAKAKTRPLTAKQQAEYERQQELVATANALEEMNRSDVQGLIKRSVGKTIKPENAALLQATTKRETIELLTKLGINLNVQLTKNDTANLLACLLTCNEAQLDSLYSNRKVPLAIKAVIKRIITDARDGNTSTIERLWDRIFGKAPMAQEAITQTAQHQGLIPGTPISREAYVILRDTLIK